MTLPARASDPWTLPMFAGYEGVGGFDGRSTESVVAKERQLGMREVVRMKCRYSGVRDGGGGRAAG